MMNEIIISLIFTNTISLITNIFQYCYQSKCSKISICCNLLEIDRDIRAEEKIDNNEVTFQFENIYSKQNNKQNVKNNVKPPKRKFKPKKIKDIQTNIEIDDKVDNNEVRPRSQSY